MQVDPGEKFNNQHRSGVLTSLFFGGTVNHAVQDSEQAPDQYGTAKKHQQDGYPGMALIRAMIQGYAYPFNAEVKYTG
ncbi:MAG: hypothetical protein JRI47_01035 [Deltaproteobacteria bacterium]|nr:hypothetical protein [Deltaproteobacteria bacterium]